VPRERRSHGGERGVAGDLEENGELGVVLKGWGLGGCRGLEGAAGA